MAGDSACTIPPQSIPEECLAVIRDWTPKLSRELKVVGLINIQYCIQDGQVGSACARLEGMGKELPRAWFEAMRCSVSWRCRRDDVNMQGSPDCHVRQRTLFRRQ